MVRPHSRRLRINAPVRALRLAAALFGFVFIGANGFVASTDAAGNDRAKAIAGDWAGRSIGTLDPDVFELALNAATCAVRSGAVRNAATLTVIDYSRPSTRERLWVFDLASRTLVYEELVAHGQGSGDNVATAFSNQPDSHQTSIGLFATGDTYVGKNGYSLRLRGLDEGFNDKAVERAIVMHGAPYVNEAFARANGRLGRSWGCPALDDAVAREIIDTVKGSGLLFSYYPDSRWLSTSKFLGACAAPSPAL